MPDSPEALESGLTIDFHQRMKVRSFKAEGVITSLSLGAKPWETTSRG